MAEGPIEPVEFEMVAVLKDIRSQLDEIKANMYGANALAVCDYVLGHQQMFNPDTIKRVKECLAELIEEYC